VGEVQSAGDIAAEVSGEAEVVSAAGETAKARFLQRRRHQSPRNEVYIFELGNPLQVNAF